MHNIHPHSGIRVCCRLCLAGLPPLQGNAKLPGIMAVGYIAAFSETLALAVIVSKGVAPLKDVSACQRPTTTRLSGLHDPRAATNLVHPRTPQLALRAVIRNGRCHIAIARHHANE